MSAVDFLCSTGALSPAAQRTQTQSAAAYTQKVDRRVSVNITQYYQLKISIMCSNFLAIITIVHQLFSTDKNINKKD